MAMQRWRHSLKNRWELLKEFEMVDKFLSYFARLVRKLDNEFYRVKTKSLDED